MRKTIALILIIVMLILAVSCKPEGTDQTTSNQQTSETATVPEGTTANAKSVLESFYKEDYSGKSIMILCSNVYNSSIVVQQAPEEGGPSGDTVNDALYKRDMMIEGYFGVDIQYTVTPTNSEIKGLAEKDIIAQSGEYDIILGSMNHTVAPLALSGYLYDLNELPEIKLNQEWWSKNAQTDLEINGKLFFTTGDITTRYMVSTYILCFNEKLFGEYGYENPYQLVYDGDWTIDKMSELICNTTYDLNSDNTITDDDFLGLIGTNDSFIPFLNAANQHLLVLEDGIPVVNESQAMFNMIDELTNYLNVPDVKMQDIPYNGSKSFNDNRSLFLAQSAGDLQLLTNMDDDFGILPIPKIDASQDEYYSSANPYISTGVAIPKTVGDVDIEFVANMIEVIAAISRYTSSEAQYEVTLLLKQTRNQDSLNCLRIATESTTYDLSMVYSWGANISTAITNAMLNGTSYSSTFASYTDVTNNLIVKDIAKME